MTVEEKGRKTREGGVKRQADSSTEKARGGERAGGQATTDVGKIKSILCANGARHLK